MRVLELSWRVSSWEISVESLHNESSPWEFWNCLGEFHLERLVLKVFTMRVCLTSFGIVLESFHLERLVLKVCNESSAGEFWDCLGEFHLERLVLKVFTMRVHHESFGMVLVRWFLPWMSLITRLFTKRLIEHRQNCFVTKCTTNPFYNSEHRV